MISTALSVLSLRDAVDDNTSLGYETYIETGGCTNLMKVEQCTGSVESENTATSYQFTDSFSRQPPTSLVKNSTSISFDLLSLQSLEGVMSPNVMRIVRDTNSYVHQDSIL